ncbi:MAG: hypothetical protein IVW54_15240 [Candidatus Binataceae bacterium]|nr:hypothetical protein [Candidatus Binataceae bacterium]
MNFKGLRLFTGTVAAIALLGGTGFAQTLAPNQTAGFAKGKLFTFTYTENFDCVDEPTTDLNFNGIKAQSDPDEMQTPICQVGTSPVFDPTGVKVKKTDKLYVIMPFFSVDNDQNPNDAIPCPANPRPGLVCGPALGSFLISNFGAVVEAYKATPNPAITVQCPAPDEAPGTCTMHASTVDLAPALAALGVIPTPPTANVFTPTPNHSHVIQVDFNQKRPVWWQVIPVLIKNQSDWPTADASSGITSFKALKAAEKANAAIEVPSNFFLFFGSQKMHM